jgi:hypothetical protein
MSDAYQKLIKTLRTVFEMDKTDLDFGIYRILNQKRAEINQFLENDLLPQVEAAFADYAAGGKSELQAELMKAIDQARAFGVADPENAPPVLAIKHRSMNATVPFTTCNATPAARRPGPLMPWNWTSTRTPSAPVPPCRVARSAARWPARICSCSTTATGGVLAMKANIAAIKPGGAPSRIGDWS